MQDFLAGLITGAVGTGVLVLVTAELRRYRRIKRKRRERYGYIEDWCWGREINPLPRRYWR